MTQRYNTANVTWYSYNLPNTINQVGGASAQFFYRPDRGRWKQVASFIGGTTETTISIGGVLEKMTRGSVVEYRHYIPAGGSATVLYTRRFDGTNYTASTYYATRDHLGSGVVTMDSAGDTLVNMSYGAFGKRRNSTWNDVPSSGDWTQIANTSRRGFPGHEHLDSVTAVHMNGRVYDEFLGRFLSGDPVVVGTLTEPQSLNPYSYLSNNPLNDTDPTGFGPGNKNWQTDPPPGSIGTITVTTVRIVPRNGGFVFIATFNIRGGNSSKGSRIARTETGMIKIDPVTGKVSGRVGLRIVRPFTLQASQLRNIFSGVMIGEAYQRWAIDNLSPSLADLVRGGRLMAADYDPFPWSAETLEIADSLDAERNAAEEVKSVAQAKGEWFNYEKASFEVAKKIAEKDVLLYGYSEFLYNPPAVWPVPDSMKPKEIVPDPSKIHAEMPDAKY